MFVLKLKPESVEDIVKEINSLRILLFTNKLSEIELETYSLHRLFRKSTEEIKKTNKKDYGDYSESNS